MPVYRYRKDNGELVSPARLSRQLPDTVAGITAQAPSVFTDIDVLASSKDDLDEVLSGLGFTFFSTDPVTTPAEEAGAVTPPHEIGGAGHLADSLANLNTKVIGGDLDFDTASRPPNGAAGGDLGGTYPSPTALAVTTTGPVQLTWGLVPDGQAVVRSGTTLVGVPAAGTDELVKISANDLTADFLINKLVSGTASALSIVELNDAGNEDAQFNILFSNTAGTVCEGDDPRLAATASLMFGASGVFSTTTTRFLLPGFDRSESGPTAAIQFRAPRAGSLKNLRVRHNVTNGNGNAIVYTLRVNSVASALTVSAASTASDGSDLANTVPVAAGDILDVQVTKALSVGQSPSDIVAVMEFA